jgi:uncharacterized protein (TIGR02996 family)
MTDPDPFLRAIVEDPDDDAVRLIYADWLEENGQPERAEFIRIQCTLAGRVSARQSLELQRRQHRLLAEYGTDWVGPLQPLLHDWAFERGFPCRIRLEAETFFTSVDEVFQWAPIQHVQLYWGMAPPHIRARDIPRLVACPYLHRLLSLDLEGSYLSSGVAQALAACDSLTRLTTLNLSGNHIGDGGVRALAASELLTRLTHLDLSNNDISVGGLSALAGGLEELARAHGPLKLQALVLRGNRFGTAGKHLLIGGKNLLCRVAQV